MINEEGTVEYEDIKRIIKELLFNGANRDITAKFNLS